MLRRRVAVSGMITTPVHKSEKLPTNINKFYIFFVTCLVAINEAMRVKLRRMDIGEIIKSFDAYVVLC